MYNFFLKALLIVSVIFLSNSCDNEIDFEINDTLLTFSKDTVYLDTVFTKKLLHPRFLPTISCSPNSKKGFLEVWKRFVDFVFTAESVIFETGATWPNTV